MAAPTSFTYALTPAQQDALYQLLATGHYRPVEMEHTRIAVDGDRCRIALYKRGKCLVQGQGAQEWVQFTLEPYILGAAGVGYEEVLAPGAHAPHMGIDESGKGDFFGPLVIAAVYVDEGLARAFREMGVKDSKRITSDKRAMDLSDAIREKLGDRFQIVTIGPRAYNRLYAKMGNVNKMLAWGHARAIENLLEVEPGCPRAVSDQFGPKRQIEQALLKKGRSIELEQRPRAESDPAVAAASILARAAFVYALQKMGRSYDLKIPKGASAQVVEAAEELVAAKGPEILLDVAKCHFRTADKVLEAKGHSRAELGPEGQAVSKVPAGAWRGRRGRGERGERGES